MVNLIFRLDLDSGKYAGTGHFKRIEMIYKNLKNNYRNIKYYFLYKKLDNSKKLLNSLSKKNHITFSKKFENKLSFIKENDIIICDTPFGIDESLKNFIIKKNLKKVILIDDLNKPKINNCTIINGIISFKKRLFKTKNIKLYQGANYILLDKNYVSKKINRSGKLFTILVCLGGTDLNNNLIKIVKILNKFSKLRILLIIGSQIKNNNRIFSLNKKKNKNIIFLRGKKNIYKYFCKANICLTAGGISMFESVSLKKPTLVYQTYNHQKYAVNNLAKKRLIHLIAKKNKIYEKNILNILDYYSKTKKNVINNSIFDNKNYYRIMNILKKEINR